MEELFNGKVLVLSNDDMIPESKYKGKTMYDIKNSVLPFLKANFVLHYDEDTMELTVFKQRNDIKHNTRNEMRKIWCGIRKKV